MKCHHNSSNNKLRHNKDPIQDGLGLAEAGEERVEVCEVIGEVWREGREVDGGERVLGEVDGKVGGGERVVGKITVQRQRFTVRLQEETVQLAAIREQILGRLVSTQHCTQRGNVLHRQPQRGDLGQLLVGLVGDGHLGDGAAQRLERLVDLPHPAALPGVGVLASVLAERRRLLLGLRLAGLGRGDGVVAAPAPHRPRPQRVLVAPGGLVGVAVVVRVGVGGVQGEAESLRQFGVVVEHLQGPCDASRSTLREDEARRTRSRSLGCWSMDRGADTAGSPLVQVSFTTDLSPTNRALGLLPHRADLVIDTCNISTHEGSAYARRTRRTSASFRSFHDKLKAAQKFFKNFLTETRPLPVRFAHITHSLTLFTLYYLLNVIINFFYLPIHLFVVAKLFLAVSSISEECCHTCQVLLFIYHRDCTFATVTICTKHFQHVYNWLHKSSPRNTYSWLQKKTGI
jgi:hypothetical protein